MGYIRHVVGMWGMQGRGRNTTAPFSLWGRAVTCCCWARWVQESHGWQTRLDALPRLELHGFTSADPLTHSYTRPSVVTEHITTTSHSRRYSVHTFGFFIFCIHVPFYKCTRPSYNGIEPNRTLEEYSTTPPTKIIMHYKSSEPC
jgi:hypothetical protein